MTYASYFGFARNQFGEISCCDIFAVVVPIPIAYTSYNYYHQYFQEFIRRHFINVGFPWIVAMVPPLLAPQVYEVKDEPLLVQQADVADEPNGFGTGVEAAPEVHDGPPEAGHIGDVPIVPPVEVA